MSLRLIFARLVSFSLGLAMPLLLLFSFHYSGSESCDLEAHLSNCFVPVVSNFFGSIVNPLRIGNEDSLILYH